MNAELQKQIDQALEKILTDAHYTVNDIMEEFQVHNYEMPDLNARVYDLVNSVISSTKTEITKILTSHAEPRARLT